MAHMDKGRYRSSSDPRVGIIWVKVNLLDMPFSLLVDAHKI